MSSWIRHNFTTHLCLLSLLSLLTQSLDAIASPSSANDKRMEGKKLSSLAYWAYGNKHQFKEALQLANQAISADATCFDAYVLRGHLRYEEGKPEESIVDLETALRLQPATRSSMLFDSLARCSWDLKRAQEAARYYSKAIEVSPGFAWRHFERGGVYMSMNQLDKALSDFQTGVKLEPDSQFGPIKLAKCYSKLRQYENAAKALSTLIRTHPEFAVAYAERAKVYDSLGKTELARADRKKANELGRAQLED